MRKKSCIAMILAGGQGVRLGILTKKLPKPAIPFGGKYRIIDFTLSNCYNSKIDTVGVLTQYQPLVLNSHIGVGSPWNLDRLSGGVFILPPFLQENGGEWYKGTANAIYQNMEFIDRYAPEYVLMLSGDHVYKMDYTELLAFHVKKKAETTIAVIQVPWNEANRFGIICTGADNDIYEFEEKPAKPKNNLASMGVYIFNWDLLKKYLTADEQDPHSRHDFGKDVIPKMLSNGQRLFAYPFAGYWKDVGTIESLWEAHMDLLPDEPKFDLHDPAWPIYSVDAFDPPHYIDNATKTSRSIISEGCLVLGEVDHTVLFPGVYVGRGSKIRDSIIMPGAHIGENVEIVQSIIGADTCVEENCHIGSHGMEKGITVIPESTIVPHHTNIKKNLSFNPAKPRKDSVLISREEIVDARCDGNYQPK